jgi:hypothetical protein
MTVDPISTYAAQSAASDLSRDSWSSRGMLSARVSTHTVGVHLGKLGVSLSSRDISFLRQEAPPVLLNFAQELEMFRLTQHVEPFRPAGEYARNATMQRLGAEAYAFQANRRSVAPMISVMA